MKKCKEIMTQRPQCLSPTATLQEGASLMRNDDFGSILICEAQTGQLLGIVTDRDIAVKGMAQGLGPDSKLEKIATWNPISCQEEESIDKAVELMSEHQIRRIPIVDLTGRLVGIISQGDIATRGEKPKKTAEVVKEISQPASEQYKQEHTA